MTISKGSPKIMREERKSQYLVSMGTVVELGTFLELRDLPRSNWRQFPQWVISVDLTRARLRSVCPHSWRYGPQTLICGTHVSAMD
jgi:hypothetical protein